MSPPVGELKKTGPNPVSAPALSPRKTADKAEISARIRELRDVVNESTGKAVYHHSLERLTQWTQLVGVAAVATLLVGGVMYWFSEPLVQLIVDTTVTWFSSSPVPIVVAVAVVVGVGLLFLWSTRATTQTGAGRHDRSEPADRSSNAPDAESTEPDPR